MLTSNSGFPNPESWYQRHMLWTILIILAIVALILFILGRRVG